ncbi:hypothetical protein BGZ72_008528 [Mortierella alpina]|nr:hypothetical protein BGZ72_008528 [Mortierella alpina]
MTNKDEVVTPYTSGVLDKKHAKNVVLEEICPTATGGIPPLGDINKSPFLPFLILNHIAIISQERSPHFGLQLFLIEEE